MFGAHHSPSRIVLNFAARAGSKLLIPSHWICCGHWRSYTKRLSQNKRHGGCIHTPNGMRSITLVPDGADTRDMVGGAWFKLGNRAKFTTAEDENSPMSWARWLSMLKDSRERRRAYLAPQSSCYRSRVRISKRLTRTLPIQGSSSQCCLSRMDWQPNLEITNGKIGLAWPRPSGTPIGRDAGRNA